MHFTTKGFVFHVIRYADTGAIVKIYTRDFGLQSYMVKGLFSKKSKLRSALFGHMSMLELTVNHQANRSLHYIGEAWPCKDIHFISDDMARVSVMMFINELLYKCIKEEEPNPGLFGFIDQWIDNLNKPEIPLPVFHLQFMLRLTAHLGFSPRFSKVTSGNYFDMEEGIFLDSEPLHRYYISGPAALLLEKLQLTDVTDLSTISVTREVRNELLDRLIDYYRLHIPEMGEMKTVRVMQEVLS